MQDLGLQVDVACAYKMEFYILQHAYYFVQMFDHMKIYIRQLTFQSLIFNYGPYPCNQRYQYEHGPNSDHIM